MFRLNFRKRAQILSHSKSYIIVAFAPKEFVSISVQAHIIHAFGIVDDFRYTPLCLRLESRNPLLTMTMSL